MVSIILALDKVNGIQEDLDLVRLWLGCDSADSSYDSTSSLPLLLLYLALFLKKYMFCSLLKMPFPGSFFGIA